MVVAVVVLVKVVVVKSDAGLWRRMVVVVLVNDERLADRMARVVVEVRLVPVIAAAVRILVAVVMLSMMRRNLFVDVVVMRLLVIIEVGQEIVYFCQELLVAN